MQYNNNLSVWESLKNKTIQDQIEEGVSASLANMKQLYYRNLEGDNMLATGEFPGRVRPIETPMKFIEKNGDDYYIANMPYVRGLIERPTDWMFGFCKADNTKSINSSIKILTAEYVGTRTVGDVDYTNCCKITLNIESDITTDNAEVCFICSFLAGGLNLQWDCTFEASGITTRWDGQILSVPASWKCSDGTYRCIVCGWGASLELGKQYTTKVFSASDRFGTWNNIGTDALEGFFDDILPSGYVGYSPAQQVINHPNKPGMFLMFIGLCDSSGAITKHTIIEFNEYLT